MQVLTVEEQYQNLLMGESQGFSLTALLSLSQKTAGFKPHRQARVVEDRVAQFARKYGIWLADRAEHYNTMTAYLHPNTSDEERLYYLGAYYAVLFFIDDVMGNEFRPEMTDQENRRADYEMQALLAFLKTGTMNLPSKLLPPTLEVLQGFRKLGDAAWLKHFFDFTFQHLELAVKDLDSSGLGYTLPVETYVEMRNHVSGMYPAVLMMEFAEDNYLPRAELQAANLQADITRLEYLCAALGGLVNDFFSFEKEVIEARSDFNLIPVMMMNDKLSLEDAIHAAAAYTNQLCDEYYTLAQSVRERASAYAWGERVLRHIAAMDASNQAVWVWQMETERYLRDASIFCELRAQSPRYAALERMTWLQQGAG